MDVTPQQAYNFACAKYEEAKKLIARLSEICRGVNANFSYQVAISQFDVVLQCVLYRAAIVDNRIYDNEKVFIRDITDYADVLVLINKSANTNFTWDDLPRFNAQQQAEFCEATIELLDEYATNFVLPFALVDYADKGRDYIAELDQIVLGIVLGFTAVDGDNVESSDADREFQAAAALYNNILSQKWKIAVQEFQKRG